MNKAQQEVMDLLARVEPSENLDDWVLGKIPKHYVRLSLSMEKALALAEQGAVAALANFDQLTYFTQALILGAALSGQYRRINLITPSQYGKSWTLGMVALLSALKENEEERGAPLYVSANTDGLASIIMNSVVDHLQDADATIRQQMTDFSSKIERMQTGASRKRIGFKNGGFVERVSLAGTFADKSKNGLLGKGGHVIIDEAAFVSRETYAEIRSDSKKMQWEDPYFVLQISNPHQPGKFMDDMQQADPDDDTLIVWMDIRTAVEEGRWQAEEVPKLESFHSFQCRSYLACRLDDEATQRFLPVVPLLPKEFPIEKAAVVSIGVDMAYKGADKIYAAIALQTPEGKEIVQGIIDIGKIVDKENWVDGVTDLKIFRVILALAKETKASVITIDDTGGYGATLVAHLAREATTFRVIPINFGSKPLKANKRPSGENADNRRAEMYLNMKEAALGQRLTWSAEVHEMLQEELALIQEIWKPNGKIAIAGKDVVRKFLGHSPDALDATVLALYGLLMEKISDVVFFHEEEQSGSFIR